MLGLLTGCQQLKGTTDDASNYYVGVGGGMSSAQLGMLYLQKKDYPHAKEKLLLAMRQAPNLPAAWYSMAYFQEVTGNINDAEKDYRHAIALNPHNGASHNNYGTFLCRQHHYQTAVKEFLLAANDKNYLHTQAAYRNAALCSQNKVDSIRFAKIADRLNSERI